MKKFTRITCTFMVLAITLSAHFYFGVRPQAAEIDLAVTHYSEIPDITPDEINAVEMILEGNDQFAFGSVLSSEAFYDSSELSAGFDSLVSGWLTMLFNVPFNLTIYDNYGELEASVTSGETDFCNSLINKTDSEQYYISDPIAERTLKCVKLFGSRPYAEISIDSTQKIGLFANEELVMQIRQYYGDGNKVIYADDYAHAYELLKNGEIAAFFEAGSGETAFDQYEDIVIEDIISIPTGKLALASTKDELKPLVDVVNKALRYGGAYYMTNLYNRGRELFKRYRLRLNLTDEEKEYIESKYSQGMNIRAFMYEDNYPISFIDSSDSNWRGKAVDVLDKVSRLTGLIFTKSAIESETVSDLTRLLEDGEIELLAGLEITRQNRGDFYITKPFDSGMVVMLSKTKYPVKSAEEVNYSRVGLVENTGAADVFLTLYPNHRNSSYFNRLEDALSALKSEKIELLPASNNMMAKAIHFLGFTGIAANVVFNGNFGAVFCVGKRDYELTSVIDKAMSFIDTEGISMRWNNFMLDSAGFFSGDMTPWLAVAATIFFWLALLLLIVCLRYWRVQKRLKKSLKKAKGQIRDLTAIVNKTATGGEYESGMEFDDIDTPSLRAEQQSAQTKYKQTAFEQQAGALGQAPYGRSIRSADYAAPTTGISQDAVEYEPLFETPESGQDKTEFLARLTNELRAPLNTIKGMTTILKKTTDPERINSLTTQIAAAADSLSVILDNMIVLSRIEAGSFSLSYEDFSLRRVVEDAVEQYEEQCKEIGIGFKYTPADQMGDWVVKSDKNRLIQLLCNAVDLMTKYTDDGWIEMGIYVKEEPDYYLAAFSFVDPKSRLGSVLTEPIPELTEDYHDISHLYEAAVLNLQVMRHLVTRMGGELSVERMQEQGQILSFSIKADKGDAGDVVEAVPLDLTGTELDTIDYCINVLFADDIEVNRTIFGELFSDTDMIIDETEDGEHTVEYFANSPMYYYDIIFIDVLMPGLNGYETIKRIRALEREDALSVPIIIMMTAENHEELELAKRLGATDYVLKPVNLNILNKLLKKYITDQ